MTVSRDFGASDTAVLPKRRAPISWLAPVLGAALLGGCASPPPLLERYHPLNWAYAWAGGAEPVNIDTAKYLPTPAVKLGNGVRMLTIFSKPGGATRESRFTEGFRRACFHVKGDFDANKICHDREDPDKILFAVALKTWVYDGSASTEIIFVEPTVQPPSPDYQAVLQRAGFVPSRVLQERRIAAATQAETEELRAQAAWPLMRERGRTVCQDREGVRYRGFVEDFTDLRMKVSITRAFFVRTPGLAPGGFRPEVIWTGPKGWFLCD